MEINDIVLIKDDKNKILYKIEEISENALITGIFYRIKKIVSLDMLVFASQEEIEEARIKNSKYYNSIVNGRIRSKGYLLGRILHLDGDQAYLDRCLDLYDACDIYAHGVCLKEDQMQYHIDGLIRETNPEIIVITGHDVYNNKGKKDLVNYTNTENFMKVIKIIRRLKSRYDCSVIAGACQSNFEALIASGADFASSPRRINIHTFDPAVIAIKVSTTSFTKIVPFDDALKFIENGKDAFGGIETLGKMKLLL